MNALEAKQGKKMIEVRLRFFTNKIAGQSGKIMPKHAWTQGLVYMQGNESHDIVTGKKRHFHSLLEIGQVIEKVLIEHGIVLIPSRRMNKYLTTKSQARSAS
jgi:hypothetical protein